MNEIGSSTSPSRSNYYAPSDLRLGCPIFLSHSGRDKGFVSFLDQALCNRGYRVFFDKEILPKAVPVSMATILGEANNKCCKLGVLVLSDDFFENTKNPMLELATFVEHKVDLLPLFYKLSVPDFKDKSRRERWYEKWRTWVPEDVIAQWKDALRTVNTITGLEFCKEAPDEKMYIDIIVDKVCQILPIDLSHSNESFQGKQRLCKIVAEMFERVERLHETETHTLVENSKENGNLQLMNVRKHTRHNIQHVITENMVVGVYGFGGTGKTSLCKALCDFYFAEFKGRVCHIEMASDHGGPLSRLTKFLSRCFDCHLPCRSSRLDDLEQEQLWNLLRDSIRSSIKPIFLCIDNVVAEESIEYEAEKYLQCGPFPKGSKIFLTARNLRVLQGVTKHNKSCVLEKMPTLKFDEARDVFLQKMDYCTSLLGFHEESEYSQVNQCVRLCTLNMGKDDFHPLMLISLAAYFVGRVELYSDPLMWKGIVAELSSDRCALDRVFKVVDLIYRDLSLDERRVYIDLALYFVNDIRKIDMKSWLCGLYDTLPASKVEDIDWYSVAEAMRPNSPQLLSMLLQKRSNRDSYIYDQRAVLSRLLYEMVASLDCFSRFGFGNIPAAVSCTREEAHILSFLEPLLAAREVVTTFLQEFLSVPATQRWTIFHTEKLDDDDGIPYYILKRSEYGVEQLNLVLVGLVSIRMLGFEYSVLLDEGLADVMAEIVQSFVSREDRSMQQGEHVVMEQGKKERLYYYKLLVMRVKEAVCRMASVPAVAEKLGESFMNSRIYRDLQESVAQEYASYLDGSLYANLVFHPGVYRSHESEIHKGFLEEYA